MSRRIEVALALVSRQGRWLICRRAPGRVFAGCWEFPGGKICPGESAERAAARETREETALEVEPIGRLGQIETAHQGRQVLLHLVHCRPVAGEPSAHGPAVVEVRWVAASRLGAFKMPPANREIIARIAAGAAS